MHLACEGPPVAGCGLQGCRSHGGVSVASVDTELMHDMHPSLCSTLEELADELANFSTAQSHFVLQ